MTIDTRCCGSGTCIVDAAGRCWCGQQWDGEKMCPPAPAALRDAERHPNPDTAAAPPMPAVTRVDGHKDDTR